MFWNRKNKGKAKESRNYQVAAFLFFYFAAVGISAWAGYYFYGDYALQKAHKQMKESGRYQSDLSYVDLPRISVTLSSDGQQSGTVRMDITLEVENKYAQQVEGLRPRITDRLIHYSKTLSYDELSQPNSIIWLKPDMLQEVRQATSPATVKDIIFREFIVL